MTGITSYSGVQHEQPGERGVRGAFRHHPVRSAILILLIDVGASIVLTQALKRFVPATFQSDFFTLIVLSALVAASVTALGWWSHAGFNAPANWRHPALLIVPLIAVVVLPLLRGAQSVPLNTGLYFVAGYVLTAFHEEVVYRGVILGILEPAGRARAIWLSALLFGLAHSANLLVRSNPLLVLAQMVGAGTGAVGLAGLRLRTNTIWIVMGIHFLEDFLLHYTRLPAIPVNVAQSVILLLVGLYILWRFRREAQAHKAGIPQPV